ncbi:MAG: DUF1566 domain-containing protein [Deltaproteobacteria bacterium]|nr:DUF1566 domain-containing protein [Deltaproteobacteria bacterium]MBF0523950.1 DUF1566 domain-containing protein [Deltaproteobacteria bacterium]
MRYPCAADLYWSYFISMLEMEGYFMIRKRRNLSCYLALIFVAAYLLICSFIPVYADELSASHGACVACKGTLSPRGRWCDNLNGTVTDMSTGLVWLKNASWGGLYPLQADMASQVTAYDRASMVKAGNPASLTDGSTAGDWSLPTVNQFQSLINGLESICGSKMYFFENVLPHYYWSSSTNDRWGLGNGWYVSLSTVCGDQIWGPDDKTVSHYIWPVRSGQ